MKPARQPLVTVLVPCRNEAKFIERSLRSIVTNGYPENRLEVLVLDGLSTDGTTEIVNAFSEAHPCVSRIANPERVTPTGLNIGIAASKGDFILKMDAHNTYEPGYIRSCVEWAERTGADNVGGVIVTEPREQNFLGRAVVAALTHSFGVGPSKFRTSVPKPVWADTVFGGCYRRDVFKRVGLYNVNLVRGQDYELNMRLKRAGLRTLLVPVIRSTYFARTKPIEFLRHNWINGMWAILPFRFTDLMPISFRHLVPMLFASALILSTFLGLLNLLFLWTLALLLGLYLVVAIVASIQIAKQQDRSRLVFAMPVVFLALHLSYGLGSVWGAIRTARPLARHLFRSISSRSSIAPRRVPVDPQSQTFESQI